MAVETAAPPVETKAPAKAAPQGPAVPKSVADIPQTHRGNIGQSKFSFGVVGGAKSGKSHFWSTFPEPIHVVQSDPNTATADGFIRQGKRIVLYHIDDWRLFKDRWLPAAMNREFEAATLVIDSWGFLAESLVRTVKGLKAGSLDSGDESGKKDSVSIREWGIIREQHIEAATQLKSCKQPWAGRRSYHIVAVCHLDDRTDDTGAMLARQPAIQGAFGSMFSRMWDATFLCESAVGPRPVTDGQAGDPGAPVHYMWTVPPSPLYHIGDSIGGKGGLRELPARLPNTYQALLAAWGVPRKQADDPEKP